MKTDLRAILERQAEWQRSRAAKPWAQKLRESVATRRLLGSLKKHTSTRIEVPQNKER